MGDTTKKTKKKKKTKHNIMNKCCVCSQKYEEKNLDNHAHSYSHHKAIEQIMGSKQVSHRCWACNVSVIGLEQYKEHIAKDEHKQNLIKLKCKRHQKHNLTVDYDTKLDAEFNTLRTQKKERPQRCFVCCHSFLAQDLDNHMHSFVHHEAIEKLKGSEQVHKCWACDLSVMGLKDFKKHIGTFNHKYKMAILTEKRSYDDKSTMDYSDEVDDELKALCAQRDQQKEQINGQEASVASPSSVSSLAEKIGRFHRPTIATCNVSVCQILDVGGNDSFRTDTDRKKKIGYNAETSQEDIDCLQIIPCNPRKEQHISNTTHQNPETTCRKNKVNELMTLSSREEELSNSLRNVGDQLFQAYATLQTAYTEVQHLLTTKQEVTSEMSSLRAKRIQLLQDMIE
ncbi:uncharacterized protein znf106b isoform X2 [Triplophysa rosa]|uniref:uncharacterized protein znf106b isoform X2 n=1 Tax=Triplophysa rosa TaxID=992332 RepID=UPI0025462AAB|nr:uncharacterized protein znf106b isoform X2 [Triplophysa rosa]